MLFLSTLLRYMAVDNGFANKWRFCSICCCFYFYLNTLYSGLNFLILLLIKYYYYLGIIVWNGIRMCLEEIYSYTPYYISKCHIYLMHMPSSRMQRKKGQFTSSKSVLDEPGSCSADWNGNPGQEEPETSWVPLYYISLWFVFFVWWSLMAFMLPARYFNDLSCLWIDVWSGYLLSLLLDDFLWNTSHARFQQMYTLWDQLKSHSYDATWTRRAKNFL